VAEAEMSMRDVFFVDVGCCLWWVVDEEDEEDEMERRVESVDVSVLLVEEEEGV
jgi:hypothetical protein